MTKPIPLRARILARVMRAFFYLLYHQFAWTYDFVANSVSLGLWKKWISSVLPELKGPRILELGHGPGHLQDMLIESGHNPFGLDASPQMSKLADRRLRNNYSQPNLINGYAQNIPFQKEIFHQVVATFPSEYIIDSSTLMEIKRVLIPGGTLIILPAAWITGQSLLERSAAWLFQITGQSQSWDSRIQNPFSEAGFQTEIKRITHRSWSVFLILAKKT